MSYQYEKTCPFCGAIIDNDAVYCPKCGKQLIANNSNTDSPNDSTNNEPCHSCEHTGLNEQWLITILLCFFVGSLGIHRFYNGKIATGVIQILTLGGFGIWLIVDLILIVTQNFTDRQGNKILINK